MKKGLNGASWWIHTVSVPDDVFRKLSFLFEPIHFIFQLLRLQPISESNFVHKGEILLPWIQTDWERVLARTSLKTRAWTWHYWQQFRGCSCFVLVFHARTSRVFRQKRICLVPFSFFLSSSTIIFFFVVVGTTKSSRESRWLSERNSMLRRGVIT